MNNQEIIEEIIEGNKLIAEFMGYIDETKNVAKDIYLDSLTKYECKFIFKKDNQPILINLKYHSSQDWLMPVIHKISQLPFRIPVHIKMIQQKRETYCRIESSSTAFRRCTNMGYANLTEVTFATIVIFLKWYNALDKTCPLFKQPKK